MDNREFANIRRYLGKTQIQLARLLCVSPKAIQSFEQGWRNIPANTERQLLFLLYCKGSLHEITNPCWEMRNCPIKYRDRCTAWELKAGHFCWFITGTFCEGKVQNSWEEKIKLCCQCKVYNSMLLSIKHSNSI